jgi:hypothetical protein
MNDLAKYGKITELSLKDVFGYEAEAKESQP